MKKVLYSVLCALLVVPGLAVQEVSAVQTVAARMSGRILIQVEGKGEAWYVNPSDLHRYYLGRPADAFAVMRTFGLGVSNADFEKYIKNGVPKSLSGKILLKVEDHGSAYYIQPNTLSLYTLGKPDDAFFVMRDVGIGISNANLKTIPIGAQSAVPGKVSLTVPVSSPAPAVAVTSPVLTPPTQASVSSYVSAVVRVQCYDANDRLKTLGSGTLMRGYYGEEYMEAVMTNAHVVAGTFSCVIYSPELDQQFDLKTVGFQFATDTDFVVIGLRDTDPALNFSVSDLSTCPNDLALATPIYVIGYPASAGMSKTVTNGILSGQLNYYDNKPYKDYYVSAKIDIGNSGGLALAEYNHGYCLLGLPTALVEGSYENLGVVQNMNNLQYTE